MYILGGLITLGFFATLVFLIYKGDNPQSVNLVVGTLLTTFGTVVGYFFGASKRDSETDNLLANSTPPVPIPPQTSPTPPVP